MNEGIVGVRNLRIVDDSQKAHHHTSQGLAGKPDFALTGLSREFLMRPLREQVQVLTETEMQRGKQQEDCRENQRPAHDSPLPSDHEIGKKKSRPDLDDDTSSKRHRSKERRG